MLLLNLVALKVHPKLKMVIIY